jgi:hypothetical protein
MEDREPDQEQERTERLPKTGLRVPVPKREDVMAAIAKVSRPEPDEDESDESP